MSNNKNAKNTVWIYAVILFTSAFIVLLVTAYSQIKFKKNIIDFEDKITIGEKEKINFQLNLNSAVEELKKISEENTNLKREVTKSEEKYKEIQKEKIDLIDSNKKKINNYEKLLIAEQEFLKGNYIVSSDILLKEIDSQILDENGKNKYLNIKDKSYKKAAYNLYNEGYTLYVNKDYYNSFKSLEKSILLSKDEYFSDDCYYFMAYCEYNLNNVDLAKNYMKILIDNYPSSSYINDSKYFISKEK